MHCVNGHDTINSIGNCYTCGEPISPLKGDVVPKAPIVLCPDGHDTINEIGNCYTCGKPAVKEDKPSKPVETIEKEYHESGHRHHRKERS